MTVKFCSLQVLILLCSTWWTTWTAAADDIVIDITPDEVTEWAYMFAATQYVETNPDAMANYLALEFYKKAWDDSKWDDSEDSKEFRNNIGSHMAAYFQEREISRSNGLSLYETTKNSVQAALALGAGGTGATLSTVLGLFSQPIRDAFNLDGYDEVTNRKYQFENAIPNFAARARGTFQDLYRRAQDPAQADFVKGLRELNIDFRVDPAMTLEEMRQVQPDLYILDQLQQLRSEDGGIAIRQTRQEILDELNAEFSIAMDVITSQDGAINSLRERLVDQDAEIADLQDWQKRTHAWQAEIAKADDAFQTHQVIIAGARSTVNLFSTILQRSDDPEIKTTAIRVGVVGNAICNAADSINNWQRNFPRMLGKPFGQVMSSAILTGSIFSASFTIFSALLGEQQEDPVSAQLRHLSSQITAMHEDMHDRFNRIDQSLNKMYTALSDQMQSMLTVLQSQNKVTHEMLRQARYQLILLAEQNEKIAEGVATIQTILRDEKSWDFETVVRRSMFYYERIKRGMRYDDNPPNDFISNYDELSDWAAKKSLLPIWSGEANETRNFDNTQALLEELDSFEYSSLHENLNYVIEKADRLLGRIGAASTHGASFIVNGKRSNFASTGVEENATNQMTKAVASAATSSSANLNYLPNAAIWFTSAEAWLQLVRDHPWYTALRTVGATGALGGIIDTGKRLQGALNSLSTNATINGVAGRRDVFWKILPKEDFLPENFSDNNISLYQRKVYEFGLRLAEVEEDYYREYTQAHPGIFSVNFFDPVDAYIFAYNAQHAVPIVFDTDGRFTDGVSRELDIILHHVDEFPYSLMNHHLLRLRGEAASVIASVDEVTPSEDWYCRSDNYAVIPKLKVSMSLKFRSSKSADSLETIAKKTVVFDDVGATLPLCQDALDLPFPVDSLKDIWDFEQPSRDIQTELLTKFSWSNWQLTNQTIEGQKSQERAVVAAVADLKDYFRHQQDLLLKKLDEDTKGDPSRDALTGVKRLLTSYLVLGLPQSWKANELLRSLLYGERAIPSGDDLFRLYGDLRSELWEAGKCWWPGGQFGKPVCYYGTWGGRTLVYALFDRIEPLAQELQRIFYSIDNGTGQGLRRLCPYSYCYWRFWIYVEAQPAVDIVLDGLEEFQNSFLSLAVNDNYWIEPDSTLEAQGQLSVKANDVMQRLVPFPRIDCENFHGLSVSEVDGPKNAEEFFLDTDGSFIYRSSRPGIDSFTYQLTYTYDTGFGDCETLGSEEATVTIRVAKREDVNLDTKVDIDDVRLVMEIAQARGIYWSTFDLNGDGLVNVIDARQVVLACDNSRCLKH